MRLSEVASYYHFSQAIWRKVQSIGLQQEHQTQGSEVKKFFRRVIALPFVPVRYVLMAWSSLKAEKPSVTGIQEFIDYFEHTWLNGQFQLTTWNVFMEDGPRTNNNLEGWHNKVKKIAGKSHLNIFEMVELFRLEQASTEVGLRQLMTGGALRSVPPKQRNKERRLKKIQEKFDNGN